MRRAVQAREQEGPRAQARRPPPDADAVVDEARTVLRTNCAVCTPKNATPAGSRLPRCAWLGAVARSAEFLLPAPLIPRHSVVVRLRGEAVRHVELVQIGHGLPRLLLVLFLCRSAQRDPRVSGGARAVAARAQQPGSRENRASATAASARRDAGSNGSSAAPAVLPVPSG